VERLGAFSRVNGFLASESKRIQVGGDLQSRTMSWAMAREIGVALLIFTFRRPVMKRNFGKGIGVLLFGAVLGLTGCDGGGIEPGIPDASKLPPQEPPPEFKVNAATGPKEGKPATPPPKAAEEAPKN
jgi:hypothetical protein